MNRTQIADHFLRGFRTSRGQTCASGVVKPVPELTITDVEQASSTPI